MTSSETKRVKREKLTLSVMAGMYCSGVHGTKKGALCPECAGLTAYALEKIDRCPFKTGKPTCLKCPVHCYSRKKREEVRRVMRYSGPKMLLSHPVLTFFHILDGRRRVKTPGKAG
jgi:hypothetical protein